MAVKFIRDLTKRPVLLKDAGLFSPLDTDSKDRVLVDAALNACFDDYKGERDTFYVGFVTSSGIKGIEEIAMSCHYC